MKQIKVFRYRKALHGNKKGGIEGLPLQLLIIIVIASLGLAMMVGWMNNIDEPDVIDDVELSYEKVSGDYQIKVRALDQNGYGIEGADVIITGYGAYTNNTHIEEDSEYVRSFGLSINGTYYQSGTPIPKSVVEASGYRMELFSPIMNEVSEKSTPHGVTDEEGFAVITVHFDSLKTYGTLNVEVSKSGYTGNTTSMKVFA